MIRTRLSQLFVVLLALTPPAAAVAQDSFPNRPINIVVPFGAGGGPDVQARFIAQLLSESLRSTVLVLNRPGAGSMLATNQVAKANPDGYTLLAVTNSAICAIPVLYKKVEYDPLRDFVGLSMISTSAFVLAVAPNGPIQSVPDLIQRAKAAPTKLNFATSGVGSSAHVLMEMLMQQAQIEMTAIPYPTISQGLNDVVAGRVDIAFGDSSAVPLAKSGLLKLLAVSTKNRFPPLADIPPVAEQGVPTYDVTVWVAMVAPSKTPAAVVQKLHTELRQVVSSARYKEFQRTAGLDNIIFATPAEMHEFFKSEVDKWGKVLRQANLVGIQ